MKTFKLILITICQRGFAIFAHIFAFVEISASLGQKVLTHSNEYFLQKIYILYVAPLTDLYIHNIYLFFAAMIALFSTFSRGTVRVSRYIRFNVVQAILLNIICAAINSVYPVLPVFIRESKLGIIIASNFYIGIMVLILYCSFCIITGRYAQVPVLSEGARLQVQLRPGQLP